MSAQISLLWPSDSIRLFSGIAGMQNGRNTNAIIELLWRAYKHGRLRLSAAHLKDVASLVEKVLPTLNGDDSRYCAEMLKANELVSNTKIAALNRAPAAPSKVSAERRIDSEPASRLPAPPWCNAQLCAMDMLARSSSLRTISTSRVLLTRKKGLCALKKWLRA